MTAPSTDNPITRLDVRPLLAAGEEPFSLIMRTADRIPPRGTLELTAPFEPVPLYAAMRRRGFTRSGVVRERADWVVSFRETGITATSTLADVVRQRPAAARVLAAHGLDLCCGAGKTLDFAARAHGLDLDQVLEELQATVA